MRVTAWKIIVKRPIVRCSEFDSAFDPGLLSDGGMTSPEDHARRMSKVFIWAARHAGSDTSIALAVWHADTNGIERLDELVERNCAAYAAPCAGYPDTYVVQTSDVIALLGDSGCVDDRSTSAQPELIDIGSDSNSVDWWAISACDQNEWLVVWVFRKS